MISFSSCKHFQSTKNSIEKKMVANFVFRKPESSFSSTVANQPLPVHKRILSHYTFFLDLEPRNSPKQTNEVTPSPWKKHRETFAHLQVVAKNLFCLIQAHWTVQHVLVKRRVCRSLKRMQYNTGKLYFTANFTWQAISFQHSVRAVPLSLNESNSL